jgi:hypothetical protein
VPLKDCIKGRVYRLRCRNLLVGVFDGKDGFMGIRTKFGHRYLFTEYHWEQGAPFGTVAGAADLGIDVPEDIPIVETLGSIDRDSKRPVERDADATNPHYPERKGWWRYIDTGEVAGPEVYATAVANDELFAFLERIDKEQREQSDGGA